MTAPDSLTLRAYAKLNLALAVGPPQPPKGYHPIASWFVGVELHDTLTLERLAPDTPSQFTIRWAADAPKPTPIDWPVEKDLAVRAHALLQRHTERELPVRLILDKRTPVGGGLGGGSSDAATALRGLNALFSLGIPPTELAALSTRLGSDIAFFLDTQPSPRPALVTGFGDRIERLSAHPSSPVLLFIPPFGCPTGPVYHAFDRAPTSVADEARIRAIITSSTRGGIPSADLFNDLAEAACLVEPRLRATLTNLRHALGPGLPVHVTGSGSTMFCLPSEPEVSAVRHTAIQACPALIALPTRLLAID